MSNSDQVDLVKISLDHLEITALTWGPKDGRVAVCLHGFPDSAWTWRLIGPRLAAKGFRVVAPFTRGYAPTEIPSDGDYHVGALMYDAIQVHAHAGGGDDAVLIGHDWGAVTSNAVSAAPQSPFRCVVSISVPPMPAMPPRLGPLGLTGLMAKQARHSWYIVMNQIPFLPERILPRVIPWMWRTWSPGYDSSVDIDRALASVPTLANCRAAISYYRALARLGTPSSRYVDLHAHRFKAPRVPLLYMHGTNDGALDPRFALRVHEVVPEGSRVEMIDRAGHFAPTEQPEQISDLITDFVDSVDQRFYS